MRLRVLALTLAAVGCGVLSPAATARTKAGPGTDPQVQRGFYKGIFGPTAFAELLSAFPGYRAMRADLYETNLRWDLIAATEPKHPRDPHDPAYTWPDDLEVAAAEANDNNMGIALTVVGAPTWANGGQRLSVGPARVRDFQDFLAAATRKYPTIRVWRIWDDVNTAGLWSPQPPESYGEMLDAPRRAAPERYARLLDGAYTTLKRADRRNIVVGGNTVSFGDTSPRHFMQAMVLPNGKPPRMDLYGHAPYGERPPALGAYPPLGDGHADFADLRLLARWVDRYVGGPRGRAGMRIFIAKWVVPSDHPSARFSFWVPRDVQAAWIRDALRLARGWPRIWGLGYEAWQDEPRVPAGTQLDGGLLDASGNRKPAYDAFRRG